VAKKDGRLVHQLFHLLFVLFFLFEIEHGTEDAIPNGAAYPESFMIVLVMVEVMVAPKGFHPFEWRVPGVDGIVHATIQKITHHETWEEHKYVVSHDQAE